MEEINSSQARRVYLLTYSKADLDKFPTRESFGNAVAMAFTNSSHKAKPKHWACCMEDHADSQSVHYHVALALTNAKRWLEAKRKIQSTYGVSVHFSENDGGYHSAYKYVCKTDTEVFHSDGHPNLSEVGSPATKKAMQGYFKRRNSNIQNKTTVTTTTTNSNEEVASCSTEEVASCSKKTCRRLTRPEVSDFCLENNIKTRTELLSVAFEQKKQGKLDLANFVLNRSKKTVCEIIETAWEMKNADRDLSLLNRERMPVIYDAVNKTCAPGCEDRLWYRSAMELLKNNNIEAYLFTGAMRNLLSKGRGKFRNLMLVGPANCGKTFLFQPLCDIFKVFCNPTRDKFGWVGADEAEIILINDLRWGPDLISWDDFLRLLEGQIVNLPAPKNHFARDVCIKNDIPILATGKSAVRHMERNISDDRETEMMEIRWKVFKFTVRIRDEDVKEIPVCLKCFADLVLLGRL